VKSPWQALLFGAVWGWLPCGLVYSVLLWAVTTGGPVQGALFMLVFGVGTLPATLTAGIVTGWMTRFSRTRGLRQTVGVLLILLALILPHSRPAADRRRFADPAGPDKLWPESSTCGPRPASEQHGKHPT